MSPVERLLRKAGVLSSNFIVFLAVPGANVYPASAIRITKARYTSTTAGPLKSLKNRECRCRNLTTGSIK